MRKSWQCDMIVKVGLMRGRLASRPERLEPSGPRGACRCVTVPIDFAWTRRMDFVRNVIALLLTAASLPLLRPKRFACMAVTREEQFRENSFHLHDRPED